MAHINICSIRNKLNEVENIILSNNFHILAMSETHLDSTFEDTSLMIEGFNIYRKDRNAYGGGICIYVQRHLPVKIRHDLMQTDIEVLWLQVHLKHLKPILKGCGYRPPSANCEYLDKMCEMLDSACCTNLELYFMADMNVNWELLSCPMRRKLVDICAASGLTQAMNKPTRISFNNDGRRVATCIDHLYLNTPEICSKAISMPIGCSDHNLIAITRKTKVPKEGSRIIKKRSFKAFDEEKYVRDVSNAKISNILLLEDSEAAFKVFDDTLTGVIDQHAPVRKATVRTVNSPWLDRETKEHMIERDQAKQIALSSGIKSDWQIYCKLRNFVTKLNRRRKKEYYDNIVQEMKHDSKRRLWSTLNVLVKGHTKSSPSYLETGGEFLTKPKDIANHLNNYFINKIDKLKSTVQHNDTDLADRLINQIMEGKECIFDFKTVTVSKVELLLMNCKNKSPGVDFLDGRLLKPIVGIVAPVVTHIINLCLTKNIWLQGWKIAKIIPIPKNKKLQFSESNSRPISLLPILSKIMEKIVYEQIQSYFSNNYLFTDFQHAYRKKYSTTTAMTQMLDDWCNEITQKKMIGTVFLDFSAAFDILDHELLLAKLKRYGFSSSALLIIKSYLSERWQMVYFNGSESDLKQVRHGVPQGSCLGPLLYSIFTNDFPLALKTARMTMYADDTTIYLAERTIDGLNRKLSEEMKLVTEWVNCNGLILNVSKTTSMVIGSNYSLRSNPELNVMINNKLIKHVKEVKLLGIIIDRTLSWDMHIKRIITKIGNILSMIRRCSKYLTTQITKQVIQALVLSHMDYCTVVWSNTSLANIRKLQLIQNKAARVALMYGIRSNICQMHASLGWLDVKHRLSYLLMVFLKNIITTKMPYILYRKLSFSSNIHNYSTRHAAGGYFILPRALSQGTVLYRAMKEWNALPNYVIQQRNMVSFKMKLRDYYFDRNFDH